MMAEAALPETTKKTLLIVGKAGSGKSSVANSILRGSHFRTAHSLNSHNTKCMVQSSGHTVVVRAPDLQHKKFLGEKFDEDEEVDSWLAKTNGEPDAIVLVMRCDQRFTREDLDLYQQLHNNTKLNKVMESKLIIVFTMGDRLYGRDLRQDLESDDPYLKPVHNIWKDAGKRYVVFDNTANELSKTTQVCTLMKVIETMEPHPFPQHVCRLLILGTKEAPEKSVHNQELSTVVFRSKAVESTFRNVEISGLHVEITFVAVDESQPQFTDNVKHAVNVAISPGPHAILASPFQHILIPQLLDSTKENIVEEFTQAVEVNSNVFEKTTLMELLQSTEFPPKRLKGHYFHNNELKKIATEIHEETVRKIENRSYLNRLIHREQSPYQVYLSVKAKKIG